VLVPNIDNACEIWGFHAGDDWCIIYTVSIYSRRSNLQVKAETVYSYLWQAECKLFKWMQDRCM